MMRLLYNILGVMVMSLATSCSDDITSMECAQTQKYIDVNISTQLGGSYTNDSGVMSGSTTRADFTALSGFTAVSNNEYDMRYKIELWSSDGSKKIDDYEVIEADITAGLSYSFRAIVGDYKLVIFADYVKTDGSGVIISSHYDTTNLNEITIQDRDYIGSDSSRDCYGYCNDLTIDSSFTLSATLKRPMAMMTLADTGDNISVDSAISITYSSSIPSGYNLLEGTVKMDDAVTPKYPDTNVANQEILAYDYIFVDAPTSYYMDINVASEVRTSTIGFEQNKITNITSDFCN